MAQSQKELETLQNSNQRKKSTSKMATTKEDLVEKDPVEVFEWEVEALDAGLKEPSVVGKSWSESRKAFELNMAIKQGKTKEAEDSNIHDLTGQLQTSDPNLLMIKALQSMQTQLNRAEERAREDREAQHQAMQPIAEKVGGTQVGSGSATGGGNKSRAKGRHPEKLERDVDYAAILRWEKNQTFDSQNFPRKRDVVL